jgi:hypothetical protein
MVGLPQPFSGSHLIGKRGAGDAPDMQRLKE